MKKLLPLVGIFSGLTSLALGFIAQAAPAPLSACVSIQGNGANFPSHIGTYIALLENNIMPVVSIGGSSGALIGSAMMALVDNPSFSNHVNGFATNLSPAQRVALVLAAAQDVTNDFLFVPALDHPGNMFLTLARFSYALFASKTIPSAPNRYFMNIESAVGQGIAVEEFMRTFDFSTIYTLDNYAARRAAVRSAWHSKMDFVNVSMSELLGALAISDQNPNANDRTREIARRVFFLMREDPQSQNAEDPAQALARYEEQLAKWERGGLSKKALDSLLAALNDDEPTTKNSKVFLKSHILLPNPDIVWQGYLGRDQNGNTIPIPAKLVLHSTLRRVNANASHVTELSGWNNLLQGYLPSPQLASAFVARKRIWETDSSRGFFQYLDTDSQNLRSLFSPEQVMILDAAPEAGRGLAWALRVSASEPNGFRRIPFYAAGNDSQWNNALPSPLINFGGWMEFVALGDLTHLPQCANADFFVSGSLPDSLHAFGVAAIRGAMLGNFGIWAPLLPPIFSRDKETEIQKVIGLVNDSFQFQRSLSGKVGILTNDLNWDDPKFGIDPSSNRAAGMTFQGQRSGLLLRSYENILLKMKGLRPFQNAGPAKLNPFGMAFYPDSGARASSADVKKVIDSMEGAAGDTGYAGSAGSAGSAGN